MTRTIGVSSTTYCTSRLPWPAPSCTQHPVQEDLYTPVVGQLGTVGSITVLGHVYMAGYVGIGYGLEEDGVSIASITGKHLNSP